jgi:hypothetical protein
MASYKVLQDIEAEDKLVGALSLRQFVYAGVSALCFYLSFIVISKGVAFLLVLFLPPGLFCGFFAFPFGRDQPTEVWALAKIRFYLKPRRRIWNQSGVKELVTVTAPKHIEKAYTDGLSPLEVQSRLSALANTIDSRGWAIKNVNVNLYAQPSATATTESDRLIDMSSLPQEVSNIDITASDDMLDAQNNPIAQQFDAMITQSSQAHRQQIVNQLQQNAPAAPLKTAQGQPPADYWFLNQPAPAGSSAPVDTAYVKPQVVFPGASDQSVAAVPAAEPTESEEALIKQLEKQGNPARAAYSHLKNIHPLGSEPVASAQPPQTQNSSATPVTPPADPAKIELARNNDLNIDVIARLANKKEPPSDEVIIPLR